MIHLSGDRLASAIGKKNHGQQSITKHVASYALLICPWYFTASADSLPPYVDACSFWSLEYRWYFSMIPSIYTHFSKFFAGFGSIERCKAQSCGHRQIRKKGRKSLRRKVKTFIQFTRYFFHSIPFQPIFLTQNAESSENTDSTKINRPVHSIRMY